MYSLITSSLILEVSVLEEPADALLKSGTKPKDPLGGTVLLILGGILLCVFSLSQAYVYFKSLAPLLDGTSGMGPPESVPVLIVAFIQNIVTFLISSLFGAAVFILSRSRKMAGYITGFAGYATIVQVGGFFGNMISMIFIANEVGSPVLQYIIENYLMVVQLAVSPTALLLIFLGAKLNSRVHASPTLETKGGTKGSYLLLVGGILLVAYSLYHVYPLVLFMTGSFSQSSGQASPELRPTEIVNSILLVWQHTVCLAFTVALLIQFRRSYIDTILAGYTGFSFYLAVSFAVGLAGLLFQKLCYPSATGFLSFQYLQNDFLTIAAEVVAIVSAVLVLIGLVLRKNSTTLSTKDKTKDVPCAPH